MTANKKSGAARLRQTLLVRTARRTEMQDVTDKVEAAVRESGCADGVCYLYVPHTTAGVIINEGYDPAVAEDIAAAFDRLVPRVLNSAHAEGNSDSHIKTALAGVVGDRVDRLRQARAGALAADFLRGVRRAAQP